MSPKTLCRHGDDTDSSSKITMPVGGIEPLKQLQNTTITTSNCSQVSKL